MASAVEADAGATPTLGTAEVMHGQLAGVRYIFTIKASVLEVDYTSFESLVNSSLKPGKVVEAFRKGTYGHVWVRLEDFGGPGAEPPLDPPLEGGYTGGWGKAEEVPAIKRAMDRGLDEDVAFMLAKGTAITVCLCNQVADQMIEHPRLPGQAKYSDPGGWWSGP